MWTPVATPILRCKVTSLRSELWIRGICRLEWTAGFPITIAVMASRFGCDTSVEPSVRIPALPTVGHPSPSMPSPTTALEFTNPVDLRCTVTSLPPFRCVGHVVRSLRPTVSTGHPSSPCPPPHSSACRTTGSRCSAPPRPAATSSSTAPAPPHPPTPHLAPVRLSYSSAVVSVPPFPRPSTNGSSCRPKLTAHVTHHCARAPPPHPVHLSHSDSPSVRFLLLHDQAPTTPA